MSQINYYELKKQLEEIRETIVIFYGNAITKQNDIYKVHLIELQRKSLLKTIDQIMIDYKRLAQFGGVENLIHIASTTTPNDLFASTNQLINESTNQPHQNY